MRLMLEQTISDSSAISTLFDSLILTNLPLLSTGCEKARGSENDS